MSTCELSLINKTAPCNSNFRMDNGFIGDALDLNVTNDVTK